MLALITPIKERLQALPQLAGWDVQTGTETADRRLRRVIDVRCTGADAQDSETQSVRLNPAYTITIVVPRSNDAAGQLDDALAAVVGALHNWHPGRIGARQWSRVALRVAREAEFTDTGLAAYELVFTTGAVYDGAGYTK